MSTHKRYSTIKRARFAPITAPTRSQYTPPPSSPFLLSRLDRDAKNPPHTTANTIPASPRLPAPDTQPSSRRNSNIDEQVSGTIHPQSTRDQYRQQHPAFTNSPPSTPQHNNNTLPYHHQFDGVLSLFVYMARAFSRRAAFPFHMDTSIFPRDKTGLTMG